MQRKVLFGLVALIVGGAGVAYGDVWRNVFEGLDLLVTPSGLPLQDAGDGTLYNGARSGRVRIVPNGLWGGGYRLELDRTFGNDSRGRPETFRMGPLELTLDGNIQATAGYNRWFKDFRSGSLDFRINGLNYTFKTKSNAQDVELSGSLSVSTQLEINPAGFYLLSLNASNTGSQFKIDGVVVRDTRFSNFDVGPVVVKGNIFYDMALTLLNGIGVDTSALEEVFPRSPINALSDALALGLQESRAVAGETVENELAPLLVKSVLTGDAQAAQAMLAGLQNGTLSTGTTTDGSNAPLLAPEPATALLLGGGALLLRRRR